MINRILWFAILSFVVIDAHCDPLSARMHALGFIEAELAAKGEDLFIVEGVAHMGADGGSVHAIRNCMKPSPPERITLLPGAPEAVFVDSVYDPPAIVIVGSDSFMILHPDSELKLLHNDAFWGGLYPTSVVKYHDYYVFGIRGGAVATAENVWGPSPLRYFEPK